MAGVTSSNHLANQNLDLASYISSQTETRLRRTINGWNIASQRDATDLSRTILVCIDFKLGHKTRALIELGKVI